MSPCALNRYLVPAVLGGFAVSLATGNSWLGWGGGAIVASVLWLRRDTSTDTACAWSPQPGDHVDLTERSGADTGAPLESSPPSPER